MWEGGRRLAKVKQDFKWCALIGMTAEVISRDMLVVDVRVVWRRFRPRGRTGRRCGIELGNANRPWWAETHVRVFITSGEEDSQHGKAYYATRITTGTLLIDLPSETCRSPISISTVTPLMRDDDEGCSTLRCRAYTRVLSIYIKIESPATLYILSFNLLTERFCRKIFTGENLRFTCNVANTGEITFI